MLKYAAVSDYLAGRLVFDPNAHCDHHSHEEGHTCGSYSCHEDKVAALETAAD